MDVFELYEKLYKEADQKYRCNKDSVRLKDLSHFVAMKGRYYDDSRVRLFAVGRAANGWLSLPCETPQYFDKKANDIFHSEGFKWIAPDGNCFRELHNNEGTAYLVRSAFWRVIEGIWRELASADDCRFVDYIAWSNLYKIAPKTKGNPTSTMCQKQFAACKELLEAEIDAYKPTHILLITGYDWYADQHCDFSQIFDNDPQRTAPSGQTTYVEDTTKKILNGKAVPVVVTVRPEGNKEDEFVSETVKAFSSNGQIGDLRKIVSE